MHDRMVGRLFRKAERRQHEAMRDRGEEVPDELLAHVWPTAWEHVNLTGNYSWYSTHRGGPGQLRPLREKLPAAA